MDGSTRVALRAIAAPLVALVTASAGWATLSPASASAAPVLCRGEVATIVATANQQVLTGTDGPDVISTAGYRGVGVDAGGGDDLVCANHGEYIDSEWSGVIHGGPGDDTIVADAPRNFFHEVRIFGDEGDDVLVAKSGIVVLHPGPGDDVIRAPASAHTRVWLDFGPDVDGVRIDVPKGTIRGEGHDTFSGPMAFWGTPGPDHFIGGPHADSFTDPAGDDPATTVDDVVLGHGGDDDLEILHPGGHIDGGAGDDKLVAVRGSVSGGAGSDHIRLGAGGSAQGGPGADVLRTWMYTPDGTPRPAATYSLHGGAGPDTIYLRGPLFVSGYPGCGIAVLCDYRADGGPGVDLLSFLEASGGGVHVDLATGRATFSQHADARIARIEHVEGSRLADVLKGTRHADHLDGGEGSDRLVGRGGDDVLHGGPGHDAADGGPGRDRCSAEIEHSC